MSPASPALQGDSWPLSHLGSPTWRLTWEITCCQDHSYHCWQYSIYSMPLGWGLCFLLVAVLCSVMSDSLWPHGWQPTRLLCSWYFPGKNTGVGCHFLLQGIFPTQESNPCLLYLVHWQTGSLPLHHWEATSSLAVGCWLPWVPYHDELSVEQLTAWQLALSERACEKNQR